MGIDWRGSSSNSSSQSNTEMSRNDELVAATAAATAARPGRSGGSWSCMVKKLNDRARGAVVSLHMALHSLGCMLTKAGAQ